MSNRKPHNPAYQAKAALEALKGEMTVAALSSRFSVHPTMIHQWKKALIDGASRVFERGFAPKILELDKAALKDLHAKIVSMRQTATVGILALYRFPHD